MHERPRPTPSSFSTRPTTNLDDVLWLQGAQPLAQEPAGVVVVADERVTSRDVNLSPWIAFCAAAMALNVEWGHIHGAVRIQVIHDAGAKLEVVAWMGRLGILARDEASSPAPIKALEFCKAFIKVPVKQRYNLDWAAAAYTLQLLELEE